MNNFPYPVLLNEDSSYIDKYVFNIDCSNQKISEGKIQFTINVNLNSNTLIQLVNAHKAIIIVKVVTDITTRIFKFDSLDNYLTISVDIADAKKNDTMSIMCLIVAQEDGEINFNDELKPIYGKDFISNNRKGDILAISNNIKFDIITNNLDFIKLAVDPKLKSGYKIRLNRNEYIEVSVSEEMNRAYALIKRNGNKIDSLKIFNSNLIFEVIVFILLELIGDYENYKEFEWCRQFKLVLNSVNVDLEEFVLENVESEQKYENVYELSHLIINNQIEKSLIKASKTESEN